jgi:hypothetical protein
MPVLILVNETTSLPVKERPTIATYSLSLNMFAETPVNVTFFCPV